MIKSGSENKGFSDLSKFVKRSPKWYNIIWLTAIIMAFDYFLLRSLYLVLVGILGSYLLLISIDELFVKIAHIFFPFRRILFLDFLSLLIASVFFWVIYFLKIFNNPEIMLMISVSSATMLRVLIFYTYYSDRPLKFIPPTLNYTFAAMVALSVIFREWITIIPFVASSIIYVVCGIIFVKSSTRGFAREYGESPAKIIKMFLNYNNEDVSQEVGNKFFGKLYRHVRRVPVKVLDVRRAADDTRMTTMVFPYVHPGPFGTLGSSDLPSRLQSRLADLGSDLMVFHTTTTNSNNCAGDEDIDVIAKAVRESLEDMNYVGTMSRFKKINVGKYSIGMQRFGDYGVGAIIPEREPFDDVKLREGLKVIHHIEKTTLKEFAAIDAQNNFREKAPELSSCEGMDKAFERELKRLESKYPARAGYHRIKVDFPELGPMGIQAFVTEIQGKYQAVVLTDSNNVTTEVIERAREKTSNWLGSLEIYTTDNHYVNVNNLDVNPLGKEGDVNEIATLIARTVEIAKNNITDVKIGMRTAQVRVHMGDENTYERLIDSVFNSLRTAKYTIIITIPSSIIASIAVFRFLVPII
ncbi:MAG: DUF2070 family protein [Candidatus Thermoplasmatota archaeon]|nr:DUF2070 family protein [Candidatus Thermoplasmatota archaeon]